MAVVDHLPSPSTRAVAILRGFRRVSWQRIDLDADGGGRGLVTGIRHRLPSTVEVPLDLAYELQRLGIRTVVHRDS